MGPSSSEGSTVAPMLLSSYTQQSSFNYVISNWENPSNKKDAKLETLHYYVLSTLFPLLAYLEDQWSEVLSHGCLILILKNFLTLLNNTQCTVIDTLLNQEYITIENHRLLNNIKNFTYLTLPYFLEDIPNQILHMLSTLILWLNTLLVYIPPYIISWLSQKMK